MPYPTGLTGWRDVPPPPQASRVYYSYRILVPAVAGAGGGGAGIGGKTMMQVGTFQNFAPTSTRQVVRVRGIANNGGWPMELVPGPADTSINVSYLSLYLLPLNEALGYNIGSVIDLNRQRIPFDIQEVCQMPLADEAFGGGSTEAGIPQSGSQYEVNHYYECYVSNVGRTINQGTVTIAETATIQVTAVAPLKQPPSASREQPINEIASLGATGGTLYTATGAYA